MEIDKKIPCTVAILTFNSEEGIGRCLDSAKQFEEIIICDGGSTDKTLQIAQKYNCKVIFQDIEFKNPDGRISDFSGVRNQTLQAAKNNWFLILDSDEFLSKEIVAEIKNLLLGDTPTSPKIFHVLRKFQVDGRIVDYAGTYPNYQPRLFHKNYVEGFTRKLHEKIVAKPATKYGRTKYPTIVPLVIDIPQMRLKHDYYLKMEAQRNTVLTKKALMKAIYFNLRSVVARWIKVVFNLFFCRGNKMPLAFEWISTVYSVKLSFVLFLILIKKLH